MQDALLTTREFCCVEDEAKKNKLMPDYIALILIHLKSERYKTYIENASAGNCRNNYSKKKKKVTLSASETPTCLKTSRTFIHCSCLPILHARPLLSKP